MLSPTSSLNRSDLLTPRLREVLSEENENPQSDTEYEKRQVVLKKGKSDHTQFSLSKRRSFGFRTRYIKCPNSEAKQYFSEIYSDQIYKSACHLSGIFLKRNTKKGLTVQEFRKIDKSAKLLSQKWEKMHQFIRILKTNLPFFMLSEKVELHIRTVKKITIVHTDGREKKFHLEHIKKTLNKLPIVPTPSQEDLQTALLPKSAFG